MSWSVAEFTAVSVDAAKREVANQIRGLKSSEPEEAAWVQGLFDGILDHLGLNPGSYLKVRGYGHRNMGEGASGGNLVIEIQPIWRPKE